MVGTRVHHTIAPPGSPRRQQDFFLHLRVPLQHLVSLVHLIHKLVNPITTIVSFGFTASLFGFPELSYGVVVYRGLYLVLSFHLEVPLL